MLLNRGMHGRIPIPAETEMGDALWLRPVMLGEKTRRGCKIDGG